MSEPSWLRLMSNRRGSRTKVARSLEWGLLGLWITCHLDPAPEGRYLTR
jgi:hypothetical protein